MHLDRGRPPIEGKDTAGDLGGAAWNISFFTSGCEVNRDREEHAIGDGDHRAGSGEVGDAGGSPVWDERRNSFLEQAEDLLSSLALRMALDPLHQDSAGVLLVHPGSVAVPRSPLGSLCNDGFVALLIDTASSSPRLTGDEFRRWAAGRTVFISSVMAELAAEREALADHLASLGFNVILFEHLGGREEDAETAYLVGVEQADVYVGLIGDEYGRMDRATGYSATHAEYRLALELGRRIAVWVRADGDRREGAARSFVEQLRTFHTTGVFRTADDLATSVERRLAEIGGDEDAPWVMVGDAIFRASRIVESAEEVRVEAEIRDAAVSRYLVQLRPERMGGNVSVALATSDRAGSARVIDVVVETRSRSSQHVTITLTVTWNPGRGGSGEVGTSGFSADDLTEIGLRCALLGQPVPERLDNSLGRVLVNSDDPLASMTALRLPEGSIEPVARLLVVNHLLGSGRASAIEQFAIGPGDRGRRRLLLTYTEPRRYPSSEPGQRAIEGERQWN